MSIYKDGKLIAGGRQCMPLLSFMWADHELNDASWLRADTFSWQSGAVYQAAYQHLADDLGIAQQFYAWTSTYVPIVYGTLSETPSVGDKVYIIYNGTVTDSGSTVSGVVSSSIITIGSYNFERTPAEDTIATVMPAPQTETITGTTITYYTAPDGHKIVLADQESNVAAIYAATGVAWYYILDTANQRFKLPRTKFGVTGLRDTVGKYVEAGLPNITGGTGSSLIRITGYNPTGALYGSSATDSTWGGGSASTMRNLAFDASRSNSIYGNSTTVQPQATQMYLYFYVGNFTQTALENTAGLNASLFNGKADLDFSNTSMIDYVVEKQDPNSGNNYTWYRKYASGWVEQGGWRNNTGGTITFPIAMSLTNQYTAILVHNGNTAKGEGVVHCYNKKSTGMSYNLSISASGMAYVSWQVSGLSAN